MQNKAAIDGLKRRRAEIEGDIIYLESRIVELRGDIGHIDGSLRLFGYFDAEKNIKPRTSPTMGIFRSRELPRLLQAYLRAANGPVTVYALGKDICRDKGWDATNQIFMDSLASKIRRVLSKMRNAGRVKSEKRNRISYWELGS